jgi:hypothetical protein
MIGRVPFVLAVCKVEESAAGFNDPNTFVVPAAAVPASDVRKNLRRDQRLINFPLKQRVLAKPPLYKPPVELKRWNSKKQNWEIKL